jgi:hypothetical protein
VGFSPLAPPFTPPLNITPGGGGGGGAARESGPHGKLIEERSRVRDW